MHKNLGKGVNFIDVYWFHLHLHMVPLLSAIFRFSMVKILFEQ